VVDVLEVLLAKISELDPDLASNLIVGRRRDADAARFGDAFEPCRKVYTVAEEVPAAHHYISDMDTDAKLNAAIS
jgi:hypothetical protein